MLDLVYFALAACVVTYILIKKNGLNKRSVIFNIVPFYLSLLFFVVAYELAQDNSIVKDIYRSIKKITIIGSSGITVGKGLVRRNET